MKLSPRAEMVLGAGSAVLLTGILGLAWWLWRHRPGHKPVIRWRRTRDTLVALGLLVIAVGTVWRLVIAIKPVPECSPPGGPLPASPVTAWVVVQKVATWPETGIGLLYSQVTGAKVCFSRAQNYYVAVNANHIAGYSAVAVGDVVLKPGLSMPRQDLKALVEHEARHREQWAVGTASGGPFAFPIVYGITDFFFPAERNPFERMAGLESGGYTPSGTGPVLGPAQFAVLGALGAGVIAAPFVVRYQRAAARSRGQHRRT